MAVELCMLARADGSARWFQDSAVLAAVYGPRQAMQRKEDAERAVIEVVIKPLSGAGGACR
jgi:exosome complex component RRP46